MAVPNLKRVKVTSPEALRLWLTKQPDQRQSVLLVTYSCQSHEKHVSRDDLRGVLTAHGWTTSMRYTLNPNLLGHVVHKAVPGKR